MNLVLRRNNIILCGLFFLSLLLLPLFIHPSSIWVDEFQTYAVVSQPDFSEFCTTVFSSHGAIGGMPLYFLMEWGWCKVFGFSEWAMRSSNLPFAAIYLLIGWLGFLQCRTLSPWFYLLFILNPIFLYYLNEARPYIMLLAFGGVFTYILLFLDFNKFRNLIMLHVCFLLGFFTHMMFAFILVTYGVKVIQGLAAKSVQIWAHTKAGLLFLIPNALLLGYYLMVLSGAVEVGGGGAPGTNTLSANVVQVIYYFLGFGGLALSRNDLRRLDFEVLTGANLLMVALLSAGFVIALMFLIRHRNKFALACPAIITGISVTATFCVFVLANYILQTRFWERHLIYLLPGFLFVLAFILSAMWEAGRSLNRVAVLLLLLCLSLSGWNTVFNPYYGKEDYKGVVEYLQGLPIKPAAVLQGDKGVYSYYGLTASSKNGKGDYTSINNYSQDAVQAMIQEASVPFLLVISARREYDKHNVYKSFSGRMTQLVGFRCALNEN